MACSGVCRCLAAIPLGCIPVCLPACPAAAGITATPMVGPFLTGKPDATQEGKPLCLHC
jgi:hypothetical protein